MTGELLERPSVRRVREALAAAGTTAAVVELDETARTADDAARSIGCPVGAIVKSLVFVVDQTPVMALIAGDRQCATSNLTGILGLEGKCGRASPEIVREWTGFAIGGVAPVAHARTMPIAMDESLTRFETVYAAAGHTHCVFSIEPKELARITGAMVSDAVAG
jgi:prolyl-tRNA editing enzyme YbaK/EbsC (Cys-tRNA(Pro) deacylase)